MEFLSFVLGFAFGPWLPFIAVMFVAAFIGTWLERWALVRMGDARFHRVHRVHRVLAVVLPLLALRLLISGMVGATAAAVDVAPVATG